MGGHWLFEQCRDSHVAISLEEAPFPDAHGAWEAEAPGRAKGSRSRQWFPKANDVAVSTSGRPSWYAPKQFNREVGDSQRLAGETLKCRDAAAWASSKPHGLRIWGVTEPEKQRAKGADGGLTLPFLSDSRSDCRLGVRNGLEWQQNFLWKMLP